VLIQPDSIYLDVSISIIDLCQKNLVQFFGSCHGSSAADKLTYCAFFDKSTNFGTDVEQYIINRYDVEPLAKCPLAAVAAKWPPADTQKTTKVR